jgi:hypothetical protein
MTMALLTNGSWKLDDRSWKMEIICNLYEISELGGELGIRKYELRGREYVKWVANDYLMTMALLFNYYSFTGYLLSNYYGREH